MKVVGIGLIVAALSAGCALQPGTGDDTNESNAADMPAAPGGTEPGPSVRLTSGSGKGSGGANDPGRPTGKPKGSPDPVPWVSSGPNYGSSANTSGASGTSPQLEGVLHEVDQQQ